LPELKTLAPNLSETNQIGNSAARITPTFHSCLLAPQNLPIRILEEQCEAIGPEPEKSVLPLIRRFATRARKSLLVQNASWLFAGQGLSLVAQSFSFIVLARLLGTTQYGLLAGAIALVSVVSQYSALGSGLLFLRYVSPDHSRFRLYWGNVLMSILLLGGLLAVALRLSGHWLLGAASVPLLLPIAIGDCLFQQFSTCAGQVFQAFEKMKFSTALILLSSLLRAALALGMLLVLGRASAWQWAIGSLVVSSVSACIAFATVTRFFGLPSFSPSLFMRRSAEGFVFAVSGSTTAVYNDIDKVVLSHSGLVQANGIYSMAYRIINIGTMPIMSIASAAFPSFFRAGVKGIAATLPMARQLLKRTAVLGVVCSAAMFLCAPVIPHLVGKSYAESISALRWLCLIPVFRCFHLSAGDAIAGAGQQKFRLFSQSAAALGNLLMNLYLVPRYSWHGAAWASLATDGALGVMNWLALFYLSRRPLRVGVVAG
jgi:O-antigen/teichoic acid export membrane protein